MPHEKSHLDMAEATTLRSGAPSASHDAALRQLTLEGPGKRVVQFPADGVSFSSRFDGGSLGSVERVAADKYVVTIPEDAPQSGISTGYTTWFYFEVLLSGEADDADARPEIKEVKANKKTKMVTTGGMRELTITLANMNHQPGLFANGYTVMHCVMDARAHEPQSVSHEDLELFFENERKWMRLATPLDVQKYTQVVEATAKQQKRPSSGNNDEGSEHGETGGGGDDMPTTAQKTETKMRLTFTHHVQFPRERVRFAFCYPFTYTKIQRQLASIATKVKGNSSIYFHRDVVTHSLGGLPIELVTISSTDGMLESHESSLPALYPIAGTQRARAFDVMKKSTVFVTARVHPGETPANFMMDGMLRLLLHATDERAECLRRHFVFKIIPVLNPDGVCQGFYRTDLRGVNLNRVYENPDIRNEPAVYATKQLLLNTVDRYGRDHACERVVYLDLHAHANHRGCFVYGNSLVQPRGAKGRSSDWSRQVATQLYAKLSSLHSPFFDYGACSFDAENMTRHDARNNNNATTSRAGSSRVGLFRATDLTYVYTIECNYNEGRRRLEASTKQTSRPKAEPTTLTNNRIQRHAAPLGGRLFIKYSPAEWIDVGIGCLLALLDLFQITPARSWGPSPLADSPYRTLDGVKKSILADLKAAELGKESVSTTQQTSSVGPMKVLTISKPVQTCPPRNAKTPTAQSTQSKY